MWSTADEELSKIIYKPRILTIDHSVHMLCFLRQVNILNFPRKCGTSVKVEWGVLDGFCWKFNCRPNGAKIVKIGSHLTELSPIVLFLWTTVVRVTRMAAHAFDWKTIIFCYKVLSLFPNAGIETEFNQTLPRVRKWARFERDFQNFRFLSLKGGTQKLPIFWWIYDDITT